MKIRGITIVKDEADIIAQTLSDAVNWCDEIYVFDNGSTDGTLETIQELSRVHKNIILYGSDNRTYSNRIRNDVFQAFKDRAERGDWWCKLDSDEFYIDHPHRFLARIPEPYDLVFGSCFQYYFTDEDLKRYNENPALYDPSVPIHKKLRSYSNNSSEPRFVRHVNDNIWEKGHPYAENVYPVRIWLKHYQYRSPEQINRRIGHRLVVARNGAGFKHELSARWTKGANGSADSIDDWKTRIVDAKGLDFDRNDGRFVFREDLQCALPRPGIRADFKALLARAGRKLTSRLKISTSFGKRRKA